ncbi:mesothelin-like protein [Chanodichthys erythropterus]|uniref:mesothelin-like protein n=1 Tax=Chanodichthys erythropterus TaxID=933992 RepID=UPI00351E2027
MTNVPNEMAVQIPRNFLSIPTDLNLNVVKQFNNKKWKSEQAVLFFDTVANAFDQPDDLSVEILQGFTCSRVQTFTQTKIRGLIKACRRRAGRPKVVLSETQLTCMYNLVKKESPVDFESYHPDMLLYYNYEAINKTTCQAYFTQVGAADLSIFSSTLRGRRDLLWSKYIDCFGISGTSIPKQNLTVLGNLACAANSTFITNSDPEILENLKKCNDLSDGQISAMEAVVMKGASKYGPTSTWNQKTLGDLGILPLYFSQAFWNIFKENDLRQFLKTFLKSMRERNTPKPQLKKLFKAIILPAAVAKRATCSKETITDVIISDDAFPFGYNEDQFRNCLNADVVRDNLASLCEKIEDSAFQRIILDKLNEISPNGLSEDQVQVLKSVSRNATIDEISKWNITKADTLAALMNANDGEWSSAQSKQIITKYLSANNTLTATDLSMVKGPNLCSLDISTLSTILTESIRDADALNVTKCSSANKKALFTIANKAFPMPSVRASSSVLSVYQLIEPYLGGADLIYLRNLSSYNVSMSMATFINLDPSVITNLTVQDVMSLLGSNLQDLKTFENEPAVRNWISTQFQSELDKLGLGLTGGKADPTTTVPTTITTVKTTVASTAATPGVGRNGWSVSLSILVLIFTIIKVDII